MGVCLACFKKIDSGEGNYHLKCLTSFWGKDDPVLKLDYDVSEIDELAKKNILQRIIVTGVQPKLSLGYAKSENEQNRLTIVGALGGKYILKPPFEAYQKMPEVEALSMTLTKACGVDTVPFILIPLKDDSLAYLTKRIDRLGEKKYAMEDACQFTERLTEHKYRGSYEQIAKGITKYVQNPLLDVVKFYEQLIVSFLIGNNDMHLKNFSIISDNKNNYNLTPSYDMVAVKLLIFDDDEELALNLNGKKKKIYRQDFVEAMSKSQLPPKAIANLFKRIEKGMSQWDAIILNSFITDPQKVHIKELIRTNAKKLELTF